MNILLNFLLLGSRHSVLLERLQKMKRVKPSLPFLHSYLTENLNAAGERTDVYINIYNVHILKWHEPEDWCCFWMNDVQPVRAA